MSTRIFTFFAEDVNQFDGLVTQGTIRVHDEGKEVIISFSILGFLLAFYLVDGVESNLCRLSNVGVAGGVGDRYIDTNRGVRQLNEEINALATPIFSDSFLFTRVSTNKRFSMSSVTERLGDLEESHLAFVMSRVDCGLAVFSAVEEVEVGSGGVRDLAFACEVGVSGCTQRADGEASTHSSNEVTVREGERLVSRQGG